MMNRPSPDSAATVTQAQESLKAGKVEDAYKLFRAASLINAGNPDILAGLALCLDRLGRNTEGERQWAYLARHNPEAHAGEHALHHAACLIALGELDGAKALLRSSRNDHVDNGLKLTLLRRIATLEEREGSVQDETGRTGVPQFMTGTAYAARATDILSSNPILRAGYIDLIADHRGAGPPLTFQSVVMVTYGRTGSTLLQGMLNTIDNMRFFGENEGAFFHLFEYVETIERLSRRTDSDLPNSPFYGAGALDPVAAKQAARRVIDTYFATARSEDVPTCVGFKDVRYIDHPDRLEAYLDFLEEMFDAPAFVFLWRDHTEVLRSGWWKQTDRVKAAATLEAVERQAKSFARDRNNCFSITYADLIARTERLRGLFAFLGASFDPDRVDAVLSIPHSYNPERPEIRHMFENARRGSGR
jgi:tetratricopeptide (TPR) repeat protein